jgi:hypothetical protein
MWVYFGLTIVSTLYFGWHYIADDVVGCGIALVAVWLAAVATGQKFDGWGHLSSRPPLSPKVPVAPREVPEIDSPSGSLVRSTE